MTARAMKQQKQVLNMKVTVAVYDEESDMTVSASAGTNSLVDADMNGLVDVEVIVTHAQRLLRDAVRQIIPRRRS